MLQQSIVIAHFTLAAAATTLFGLILQQTGLIWVPSLSVQECMSDRERNMCLQRRRSSNNTPSACRSLDPDLSILYHVMPTV